LTTFDQYRTDFRKGFTAGYSDGYFARAYDDRYNVPRLNNEGGQILPPGAP
jgi:hypothetical protein